MEDNPCFPWRDVPIPVVFRCPGRVDRFFLVETGDSAAMIRLLIADDHRLMAETLSSVLEAYDDMRVVGCAADGHAALALARDLRPDIVVMDLAMPLLNGVEATERIMSECPGTKVVCLTMHSDAAYVERALKAGAMGYVLKSSALLDLAHAVRAVASGHCYLSSDVTDVVITGFVSPERSGVLTRRLTRREREILQLVAEGMSSKEIAGHLNLSVRTVENHRRRICMRLNLNSVAALTKYAIRHGLTDLEH